MRRAPAAAVVVPLLAAVLVGGCGSATSTGPESGPAGTSTATDRVSVVAAFYPLQYAAESVGGSAVDVTSLTPPGVEPHDLELTAQQVAAIADADLVLYVRGFQPAVDEAVDQQAADRAIDVSAGLPLLADDPHVWLDPANMSAIGSTIADRLSSIAPQSSAAIGSSAAAFTQDMSDLDAEYAAALTDCRIRDLVVSHEAFGYLADAYGLTQVGISGLSPEAEPSPARLKEVADLVNSEGITTIYYETLVDPKVAQTVASETGASVAVLDPLEGLVEGSTGDYASIMRANLATLTAGQDCS